MLEEEDVKIEAYKPLGHGIFILENTGDRIYN